MHVAVALPAPPAFQRGAVERCAIGLLQGLRSHGVEVDAVAADSGDQWVPESDALGVRRVTVQPKAGPLARLAHLRRPLGDLSRSSMLDEMQTTTAEVALIHLETSLTAWLEDGSGLPTVMGLHYRAKLDRDMGAPWRSDQRELLLFRLLEQRIVHRYRWFTASSEPVAASIRADRSGADVTVAPISLDPGQYPPVEHDGGPVAGIIGTADWPPTADALTRLVGDIWPRVRSAVPEGRLLIAGRGSDTAVRPAPDLGIDVLGEVPTSQGFLGRLGVLLYPVQRGSGMKVKVLEAMASGLPVVTTTAGAEGIAPTDGVVISDDDAAFTAAATSLLADPDERRQRGAAARRTFAEHHAPAHATEPLVDLYHRIIG